MSEKETRTRVVVAETKDRTRVRSGIPYFLPKGLMHLVIKPAGDGSGSGGGGSSPSTTATATASTNINLPQLPTSASITLDPGNSQSLPKSIDVKLDYPHDSKDPGRIAYQVNAEIKLVPDTAAGVLYAHYSPNWLFKDDVSITVSSDGLLSAVNSTVEDRTPQIIDNLAETAVNVAQFLSSLEGLRVPQVPGNALAPGLAPAAETAVQKNQAFMMAKDLAADPLVAKARLLISRANDLETEIAEVATRGREIPRIVPPTPYIKKLNVDEMFDPLNPGDLDHVEALFSDISETDETIAPIGGDVHIETLGNGRTVITIASAKGKTAKRTVAASATIVVAEGSHVSAGEALTQTATAPVFSPLTVRIVPIVTRRGGESTKAGPRDEGLWFRELRAVEIRVSINRRLIAFLRAHQDASQDSLRALQEKVRDYKDQESFLSDRIDENIKDIKDLLRQITDKLANGVPDETAAAKLDESGRALADKVRELTNARLPLIHQASDLDDFLKRYGTYLDTVQSMLAGSYPGEQSGLGRFTAMVPDKERAFSMNVPRSAFVARSMSLTIDR